MKVHMAVPIAFGILSSIGCANRLAHAQTGTEASSSLGTGEQQKPALTPAQRRATYAAASKDRGKVAKVQFPPVIGAEVPPMIELYTLPDEVLAENHAAESYEYTMEYDKVVLVDPTRMRVVDVIGPD
jgi:hypothetical protein